MSAPEWKREIEQRLANVQLEPAREAAIIEELAQHLADYYDELLTGGTAPAEAERRTRAELNNLETLQRELRGVERQAAHEPIVLGANRRKNMIGDLWHDLRYGARMLLKSRAFTAVAVLSLALGIGANTAIFSLIDTVLLKNLPVRAPEQLHQIAYSGQLGVREGGNFPLYQQIRDHNRSFSEVIACNPNQWKVTVRGETEVVAGQVVTGNYYSALGVVAVLGRTLTVADDQTPRGHPVAVVSHAYWKRRFAQDPGVLGQSLTINLVPFTIIGVTSPEFFGLQVGRSADITVPMSMHPLVGSGAGLNDRTGWWNLLVLGRLKPEVSAEQARAEVDLLLQQFLDEAQTRPQARQGFFQRAELMPASNGLAELRKQFSEPLHILMVIVGLVLLIACANVANLLLARAAARQKEVAIRLALGAGRLRLIRQLLTESVMLALLGGLLGILLAYWGANYLVSFIPQNGAPITLHFSPDLRVLSFTVAVSLLTGVLFGLAPALRATRLDLGPVLKDDARGLGGGRSRSRLGRLLVVAQVAISLILLIGAGLFVRSLQKLRGIDTGFDRKNVLMFTINAYGTGYRDTRLAALHRELLERVSLMPGVRSASLSNYSPITGWSQGRRISVPGFTHQSEEDWVIAVNWVGPNYFETMGIPLVAGRAFTIVDNEQAPRVAVISESVARYYFANENPLGRRITVSRPPEGGECEIVGVVKDAKFESLRGENRRLVYLSHLQGPAKGLMTFALRTSSDPASLIAVARNEVRAVGKDIPITEVKTLAAQIDESLAQERLVATLSSFFGLLALLLSCIGLYGTMAYAVARRTREIGIRMALGAQPGDVLWQVMRETLLLVLIGVVMGLPVALAATRLIPIPLFGLTASDPLTIAMATTLLIAVAALAGYLPARRAAQVDPLEALRCE
jgi:predicted permease